MFIILSWDLTSFYYLNKRSSWKNKLFWLLENKGQLNFFCFHSSGSFCCVREDSKSDWNVIVDYFWLEWVEKNDSQKNWSHAYVKRNGRNSLKRLVWRTCTKVGLSKNLSVPGIEWLLFLVAFSFLNKRAHSHLVSGSRLWILTNYAQCHP